MRRIFLVVLVSLWVAAVVSPVSAQDPYINRFGIGEADRGGNINWGIQNYFTADAYTWKPDAGASTRRVYTGPDVIGTWYYAHSPDFYSEGPGHFGPNFAGPVINGAGHPVSDGLDVTFIGATDIAIPGVTATARYTDTVTGHVYNLNAHSLSGPGWHHMHDVPGTVREYVDCYDIQGFNPADPSTCNGVDQTGTNDGVYVERLNDFQAFVQNNPGRTWALGFEAGVSANFFIDPYMYTLFYRDFTNRIRTWGGAGTKIYAGDIGTLFGALNCWRGGTNVCSGNIQREPGHDGTAPLDGADWFYTWAVHMHNLQGRVDGFYIDAGISTMDDRYCWDAADLSLHYGQAPIPNNNEWCWENQGNYVVPLNGRHPSTLTGWRERQARPFMIDQDDQYRGGYIWNDLIRFLDGDVRSGLFYLVNDESHTPIVELLGMTRPSIDKTQQWGAGGRSLYWAAPGLPSDKVCPWNPYNRYDNVNTGWRAQNAGTSGVATNDITAGYVACNYRPGYNGWKVWYPSTFDLIVMQGVGLPWNEFRRDSDNNGSLDSKRLMVVPEGQVGNDGLQVGREDAMMAAGLAQQLAMKWAKSVGDGYNIRWWFVRAVHTMPDYDTGSSPRGDGVVGDTPFSLDQCSGQEFGLTDLDGGGYRTVPGEVFYHIVDPNLTNYEWWPEGTAWQTSGDQRSCYKVNETYKQRPDQWHDRDGNGNPVDFADFPQGW